MIDSLQKYLAELFGTFTLVFVGSMAILASRAPDVGIIGIAFGFGLALLAALYAFGEVSGGHFNPIVSLAMVLDKRLASKDLVPYWIAQVAGAVLASITVLLIFDQDDVAATATRLGAASAWQGVFLEMLVSAVFVLVILQSTKSERHSGTALMAIPLTLISAHFALIVYTGASLNTARSFGPALIGSEWSDFWVYVVGPFAGAIVGWAVYAVVAKKPEVKPASAG